MNLISTILASLFLAVTPLATNLGDTTISNIRKSYEKGEYNAYLKDMNTDYIKAVKDKELDGLVEVRSNSAKVDVKKWEEKASKIQKLKNRELLSALNDNDNSLFAKKVRSASAILSTPDLEKAVATLDSLLYKAPGAGKNDDENALILIDLEYEYKLFRAETAEQRFALRMEKMDKMLAASKNFSDASLKQAVGLAAANFDARLAQILDSKDLADLAKGIVKPTNPTEQKVASIYAAYQADFADLFKEIADAK
jgi:hypothetical protein